MHDTILISVRWRTQHDKWKYGDWTFGINGFAMHCGKDDHDEEKTIVLNGAQQSGREQLAHIEGVLFSDLMGLAGAFSRGIISERVWSMLLVCGLDG